MKPLILTRSEAARAAAGTLGAVLRKMRWSAINRVTVVNRFPDGTWLLVNGRGQGRSIKPPYAAGDRVPIRGVPLLLGNSSRRRAANRYLTVSAVRPVRLGDATEADAQRMGFPGELEHVPDFSPLDELESDYESTHGPGSFERDKGVWMWLIEWSVTR